MTQDEMMRQMQQFSRQTAVAWGSSAVASSGSRISTVKDAHGKKIKQGDRIRILPDIGYPDGGREFTVNSIDSDGNVIYDGGQMYVVYPHHVEVVTPQRTAKAATVSLESVILAEEKKEAIKAALGQVTHHKRIFDDWGFGDSFEKGTAISMLFWGIPGTGKTLCAQAIADTLKAPLKTLGAAEIESSEPGGAERTIQQVFAEARRNHVPGGNVGSVLLFDECDSLLMDRNEVGPILGATINCLLGEIEKFPGVVIFTTNRLGKLDPALERRITAKIEFPFPDEAARQAIWRRLIPKKAPLDKDVDLAVLAGYQIAGGNIKNAVLNAARAAAYQGAKKLTLAHFQTAIARELEGQRAWTQQTRRYDHTRPAGAGLTHDERGGIVIPAAARFHRRQGDT